MTLSGIKNRFCRKRPRTQDDELDESIPISKRINSLNIESRSDCSPESAPSPDPVTAENGHSDLSFKLWQQQQQQQLQSVYAAADTRSKHYHQQHSTSSMSLSPILDNPHPNLHSQQQQHSTPAHLLHPQHNATEQTIMKKYSPELDESSNPYYYHINEILYKAHIARLERLAKPLHSQSPHHHHQQQQQQPPPPPPPFPFNR
ncbi:unnamed protein product [Acanthosepion pharaonis]|uniref:Uncharacterized protein n=1 Tax=Acanthosepion pharaonis TaxID=158019 RepID=A0A812DSM1_ACAPH|nr:unnamed protein product [Sepia pharaonis]